MQDFHIPESEIEQQFRNFMTTHNCEAAHQIPILMDGAIHRYKTVDDKGSQTSGAYCLYADGWPSGWVQNWRNGEAITWRFNKDNSSVKDSLTAEKIKALQAKSKQHQHELQQQQKVLQAEASERARVLFEQSANVMFSNHPYLSRKNCVTYGLHIDESTNNLLVPLRDIDGNFKSLQFISPEGDKKFYTGAPVAGAFFSVGLERMQEEKNKRLAILVCEGYATLDTAYSLTGAPTVAAMSCGNLHNVVEALLNKYPECRVVILPDDDRNTPNNPGMTAAQKTRDTFYDKNNLRVFSVPPIFEQNEEGSDWNDYYAIHGPVDTKEFLNFRIREALMTPEEKLEQEVKKKLVAATKILDPNMILPPQEFIGGLFPRKFLTLLAAPSGTGKTMFMQKMCSDLSVGGSIFDGFVDNEPIRKCLFFAGEAGFELMTRRAAMMKWAINPQNVLIIDQHNFELLELDVMLDSSDGIINIKRLIEIHKPDIVIFDTFSSFHDRDENKATDMKPIVKFLANLARDFNCAVVLVHHSRKRAAKERALSLNQDDVIGSSILNRLVGVIIGIEPMKEDEKTLLVKPLKTWFRAFMPFTYKITQDMYGNSVMETDLAPANVNNSRIAVWNYITSTFEPGEWFSLGNIVLDNINPSVSVWQVKRILSDFVKTEKLDKRGSTKSTEYSRKIKDI